MEASTLRVTTLAQKKHSTRAAQVVRGCRSGGARALCGNNGVRANPAAPWCYGKFSRLENRARAPNAAGGSNARVFEPELTRCVFFKVDRTAGVPADSHILSVKKYVTLHGHVTHTGLADKMCDFTVGRTVGVAGGFTHLVS